MNSEGPFRILLFLQLELTRLPGLVEPALLRPYRRITTFQPLPGTVWTQFFSCHVGAVGPNQTSTEPSALTTMLLFLLPMLGNCWSVCTIERVWLSYAIKDQKSVAIAQSLKFADASVFTRAFSRRSSMPPTRWRVLQAARIPPGEL